MEQRHKQINDLITKIALGNPHITKAQITRARSMYNGDTRPIELIEAELLEYSESISKHARTTELVNKENSTTDNLALPKITPDREPEILGDVTDPELIELIADVKKLRNAQDSQEVSNEVTPDHESEMEAMFNETVIEQIQVGDNTFNNQNMPVKEKPMQYVKKQETTNNDTPDHNEGGYGNVPAILTMATILSIMTILMAFFTIIAN